MIHYFTVPIKYYPIMLCDWFGRGIFLVLDMEPPQRMPFNKSCLRISVHVTY